MNNKHLAILIVVIATILCTQVVLQVRANLTKVEKQVATERRGALGLESQLRVERANYDKLQNNSSALLAYLHAWEPALVAVDTPEAGELDISGRIKQSGIISLAQRFEAVATKNANIPRLVRANLTLEDDYARTLNWLGQLEHDFPAARVSNLRVTRGQSGNDIRMDLVLDLPLLKKEGAQ
jgi:hypothetical protein